VAGQIRKWLAQIADPIWVARGLVGYGRYLIEWYRYARMPGAEPIRLADTYPQLHDRTRTSSIEEHYYYVNGWAMRRVVVSAPRFHVDVASQVTFSNLLGAVVPVIFLDYRPLNVRLTGVQCLGGSLLTLPFASGSIASLSCLHVIEHVGLGRYGDPLDPRGTRRALHELARVLASGGNLFLATPIGRPRLCFNAHRIHAAETIRAMLPELELNEFSGIHDDGRYVEHANLLAFRDSRYACGLFWFRKP
jgi:SAM-dependent methyltransferase